MKENKPMTELEIEREGYGFMVGLFSIALFIIITFSVLYGRHIKTESAALQKSAYKQGYEQGQLRAFRAATKALNWRKPIDVKEIHYFAGIDTSEFKRQNGLE